VPNPQTPGCQPKKNVATNQQFRISSVASVAALREGSQRGPKSGLGLPKRNVLFFQIPLGIWLIDVAGGTEGVETVAVTSQGQKQEFDGPVSVAVSPLIGRDAELRLLEDRWEQAQEGQSQIVLVLGEAGLGKSRLVRTGGGHYRSVVLVPGEPDPRVLTSEGPMMGVLRKAEFPAQSCQIPEEARLLIFSDGVFEVFRDKRQMWNLRECIASLAVVGREGGNLMDELLNHVLRLRGSPHLNDDFSIIEARFQQAGRDELLLVRVCSQRFFLHTTPDERELVPTGSLPKRRQHHINDDAGHRDIEPDRERESGQAAMGREAAGER
jgi:Stage II sporulation protein E (SpoIIE)/AAA ATPase domain